jgi:hypothetical protein
MDLTQKAFGKSDQTRCPARIGRKDERQSGEAVLENGALMTVICPPLSGPETMIVWTTKGTMNAEQEAQAGRDYRQAA